MITIIIAAIVVVVLCWLHTRAMTSQRQTLEDRLDNQAQRHALDLRQRIDASQSERIEWHRTLTQERVSSQERLTALMAAQATERDRWLEDRTLLLNRIKPETAQPVLHTGEVFAPPAIPVDDDDAFFEDKEHMADRLAQTELKLRSLAGGR